MNYTNNSDLLRSFRVGNIFHVKDKGNIAHQVYKIHFDDATVNGIGIEKIAPIESNDERLKSLGFKWSDNPDLGPYILDLGYLYLANTMMGYSVTLWDKQNLSTGIHFDYFHEIQNAYWDLKGEILQLHLPQ